MRIFSRDDIQGAEPRWQKLAKASRLPQGLFDFWLATLLLQFENIPEVKIKIRIDDSKSVLRQMEKGFPLIDKGDLVFDVESGKLLLCSLLQLATNVNEELSKEVKKIGTLVDSGEFDLGLVYQEMLADRQEYIEKVMQNNELSHDIFLFFIKASLTPALIANEIQLRNYVEGKVDWNRGICPICGSAPMMAKFESDGGKRMVCCSLCSHEWCIDRIMCPYCENKDFNTLRYFHIEGQEDSGYRIDVCDKCHKYIKTVDTRNIEGCIVPPMDDIVTMHLDFIATNEGYKRGVPPSIMQYQ